MMNTAALRSWLLSARPAPDENKIHLGGFLLFLADLLLIFFGYLGVGAGIGITDHYSCEAVSLLPSGYALSISIFCPLIALVLMMLRKFCKSRLSYYACTGLVWGCVLASLAVVCWNIWALNCIYEHFQPLR